MKVCIVGAGAIGGLIGTRLAASGLAEVGALARGQTLSALQRHGWRLQTAEGKMQADAGAVSDRGADLGQQDIVVLAVKATALHGIVDSIGPLLGPETIVLPAMNGVPWWFCSGSAAIGSEPLQTVDRGGVISNSIPYERVIGCVVHASASTLEPGVAFHQKGNRLVVGEPSGQSSSRCERVAVLLEGAGFEVTRAADIRSEIWYKLWGNITWNPISAVTGATSDRILDDPLVLSFCSAAMRETQLVGTRIGCDIRETPEDRHKVTRQLGAFRTSMLQDAAAARPIELDAIVGAVREMAARVGVQTPLLDAIYGITRLYARTHGLYPDPRTP